MSRICEGGVAPVLIRIPDYLEQWRIRLQARYPGCRADHADLLLRHFKKVCMAFELCTPEQQARAIFEGAAGGAVDDELWWRLARDVKRYPGRLARDLALWELVKWEQERGPLPGSIVVCMLRSLVEPYVALVAGEQPDQCLLQRVPVLGFQPMEPGECAQGAEWIALQLFQGTPSIFASYDPALGGLGSFVGLQSTGCLIRLRDVVWDVETGHLRVTGQWRLFADSFRGSALGEYLARQPDHQVVVGPSLYKVCSICRRSQEAQCPKCGRPPPDESPNCPDCRRRLPWVYEGAQCPRGHCDDPVTTKRGKQDKRLISPKMAVDALPKEACDRPDDDVPVRTVCSPYVREQFWTCACGNVCDLAWERCPLRLCRRYRWPWTCDENVRHSVAEPSCMSCGQERIDHKILHAFCQPPYPRAPWLKLTAVVEVLRTERQALAPLIERHREAYWDAWLGRPEGEQTPGLRRIVARLAILARCAGIASSHVHGMSLTVDVATTHSRLAPGAAPSGRSTQMERVVRKYLEKLETELTEVMESCEPTRQDDPFGCIDDSLCGDTYADRQLLRLRLLTALQLEFADEGDHIREMLAVARGR